MNYQIFNRNILFVILATLFMVFAVQSIGHAQAIVSVVPENDSPAVDEEFVVNINITGDADVNAFEIRVTFDATAHSLVSIADAGYLAGGFATPPVLGDGTALLAALILGDGTSSGDGTLVKATFKVVEVKETTISVDVTLLGVGATLLDVTIEDGIVNAAGAPPEPVVVPPEPVVAPPEPVVAFIDRFSADAGTIFVRGGGIEGLPEPNAPIDFDQPPFISQGLGPAGEVVQCYAFDVQSTTPGPIFVLFHEGADQPVEGQHFIADAIPGDPGYSDFWNVTKVTVPTDYVANTVTSLAEIEAAGFAIETTADIVNCPVVPADSTATLRLDGGDTSLHSGWYRGEVITYFVFEEKALTASGGSVSVAPIFVSFNINADQPDGGPASGFVTEPGTVQTHNVVSVLPSDDAYSPLWAVVMYDNADFDAVSDLESAQAATVVASGPNVNCPIVSIEEVEGPLPDPPPPIAADQLFEITLENLTEGNPGEAGQVFSPPIFITHIPSVRPIPIGGTASEPARILAEDGNNGPKAELAESLKGDSIKDYVALSDPIPPGGSATVELEAGVDGWVLSLLTMLVETNDGLAAVDSLSLFDDAGQPLSMTVDVMAYDAGTEENTELAADIPGPPFGGSGRTPTDPQGVVEPHPGIRGDAEVGAEFGWTEPVARLTITPVVPVVEPEPVVPVVEPEIVAYGYAALNVDQEIPAPTVATNPAGTATVMLDDDDNLYFSVTVTDLSGPITGAHFHGPAPEGENADVIFGITDTFDGNHADGVWEGLTDEQLGFLEDGLLYLNIHTEANPPGEIRGQVHLGNVGVAVLHGDAEVPPIDVAGGGTGAFKIINGGTALWYDITFTGLTGPITGAHFHGPATDEETAGVIFGITDTFDGEHAQGVWEGLTKEQLGFLLDELVYVNIHTEANAPGEIRGQVEGLEFLAPELDVFFLMLDPGLNMISLPLMPPEPYDARRFAEEIGATTVVTLETAQQKFVGFTPDVEGEGFPIEGGKGYIVNVPNGGSAVFVGSGWTNSPDVESAAPGVNVRTTAWAFVVSGRPQNTETGSTYTVVVKNLSTGNVATDSVSGDRGHYAAVWADLSRKSVVSAGDELEITMLDEGGNIVSGPFQRTVDIADIKKAYLSLPLIVGDVRPTETLLAQNFPNPFNPETWLPYQIAESAEITIQIYDGFGRVVRTLELGFKPAGFYTTRSAAAYWDGRNLSGERVASGVYFYTMQTNNFTATRKMLILK